jgi:lysozyme
MDREKMIAELKADEGCRLQVYDDFNSTPLTKGMTCVGHPSIGIGRCLDMRGITETEALTLLNNDIDAFVESLTRNLPLYFGLDEVRQRVLINMGFQMGTAGLLGFHDMLEHMEAWEYDLAADSMADSQWARSEPARSGRLIAMMRAGTPELKQ